MSEYGMIFTVGDDEGMQVSSTGDRLSFHNHDDWCGDTESGFGAEVTIELSCEKVTELRDALDAWLGRNLKPARKRA